MSDQLFLVMFKADCIDSGISRILAFQYLSILVFPLFVVQLPQDLARWYSGAKSLKIYNNFADVITMS